MLVDLYRPKTFSEIVGQNHILYALKRIIKHPENHPKNYIFYGDYGVGKTSTALAFVNEFRKAGFKVREKEYDLTIANKDTMEDINNLINNALKFSQEKIVLIFDEFHLLSKAAQSTLLPTLENNLDNNIYFIFCTTEFNNILKTVRSRCISLMFRNIPDLEVRKQLDKIIVDQKIEINEENITLIIKNGGGHLRDTIQLLDTYVLFGEENFKDIINSTEYLINDYLFNQNNNIDIFKSYPIDVLYKDLNRVMEDWVLKNCDINILKISKILELHMKYKNYINCIEDFISVMLLLKKFIKKET